MNLLNGLQIFGILSLASLSIADDPIACPVGYDLLDNHYCFKIVPEALNFWEAVTACDVIDGKLVEIASQDEQDRVKMYLQRATGDIWLGATDLQGSWMYLTSKNKDALGSYTAWAPSYPKLYSSPKHCASVSLIQGWRWVNIPCSYHQSALCEVRLRNAPVIGRR